MNFDWQTVFLHDLDLSYAVEVLARTAIMFIIVLAVIRLSGKRGVRQLSIFEVAIIVSLGSAAGDPMFYKDVAIVPAIFVCLTIIVLYRLITYLTAKNERIEKWVEGKPVYIVEDGVFCIDNISRDTLAKDEFFSELRQSNVEHLGQVRVAILETNGSISLLFYEAGKQKPGLPVTPKSYNSRTNLIDDQGTYACAFCGQVADLYPGKHYCKRCGREEWVKATDGARIA